MAENNFINAERVVRTMLGVLDREVVVPRLVWRDAGGDFRGAKGDTITIRVPSFFEARKRSLRSGAAKTKDKLHERSVDVTLDDNLYGLIPITDEELTLDIESFERQVIAPVTAGIVRGLEDEAITEIQAANYEHTVTLDTAKPHKSIAKCRRHLNESRVPFDGRALIVGSEVEEVIITSDQFVRADQAGSDSAFREANIGRIYGFPVFSVPGLDPGEGYAFHQTAYVLNQRAPFVPRGVSWGSSEQFGGFAVRVAQQVDPDDLVDNFHADVFVGTNHVRDHGTITKGVFKPSADPDLDDGTDLKFVRAVKLTVGS